MVGKYKVSLWIGTSFDVRCGTSKVNGLENGDTGFVGVAAAQISYCSSFVTFSILLADFRRFGC